MRRVIDTTELDLMFAQLRANAKNTAPVMRRLSGDMLDAVEENFAKQGRLPRWKRLSQTTLIKRASIGRKGQKLKQSTKKGRLKKWAAKGFSGKILQHSGQLAVANHARSTATDAIVRNNKVYAWTMQEGAKKGQYGRDKHGRPIPWGNVPARPFLKFTPRDVKRFSNTIWEHLTSER